MDKQMTQLFRAFSVLTILAVSSGSAQWTPYVNPDYPSVFSITTGPGAIYMVSYGSGVIKSTNGGSVWTPSNTGLPSTTTIESVYYNGSQLFCGTHSGVYTSTNAGASWTLANTGQPASSASNFTKKFFHYGTTTLAIRSASIGNNGGIWRTTDNGVDWYSGNTGLSTNMTVYQVAEINGLLYAATNVGLYVSSNLAVGWTLVPNSSYAFYAIQGDATRMVAITSFGYRYKLGAGNWTDGSGDPPNPTGGQLILYDGKYWAQSGTGIVSRSTNGGQNWSEYETGMVGADVITQYCFHASGSILYMGALQNIYGHPGTTTSVSEGTDLELPRLFPSLFIDGFTVDLSGQLPGMDLVLIDATGREVQRRSQVHAGPVRMERGTLPAGTYRVLMISPEKGTSRVLGAVVAQ